MATALLVLWNDEMRRKAKHWIDIAAPETRVTFEGPKRSLKSNARMWAMLGDIADKTTHCGHNYPAEIWKSLFMQAWGCEVNFVPTLDGSGVLPIIYRSSELSKEEMASLIEFIMAWGTENGIKFRDPRPDAPPPIGE